MRDLRVQTPESLIEIRNKWETEFLDSSDHLAKAKEMLPVLITEHIHSPESWAITIATCAFILASLGLEDRGGIGATQGVTISLKLFGESHLRDITLDSNTVSKETNLTYESRFISRLLPKAPPEEKKGAKILKLDQGK